MPETTATTTTPPPSDTEPATPPPSDEPVEQVEPEPGEEPEPDEVEPVEPVDFSRDMSISVAIDCPDCHAPGTARRWLHRHDLSPLLLECDHCGLYVPTDPDDRASHATLTRRATEAIVATGSNWYRLTDDTRVRGHDLAVAAQRGIFEAQQ